MQDESSPDALDPQAFYREARQHVYAMLYNHYHLLYMAKKNQDESPVAEPKIEIREWVSTHGNNYQTPVVVRAKPVSWAVPTVQRLWFG